MLTLKIIISSVQWFGLELFVRGITNLLNSIMRRFTFLIIKRKIKKISRESDTFLNIIRTDLCENKSEEEIDKINFYVNVGRDVCKKIDKYLKKFITASFKDAVMNSEYVIDLIYKIDNNISYRNKKMVDDILVSKMIRNKNIEFGPLLSLNINRFIREVIYTSLVIISTYGVFDEKTNSEFRNDAKTGDPCDILFFIIYTHLCIYGRIIENTLLTDDNALNSKVLSKMISEKRLNEVMNYFDLPKDSNDVVIISAFKKYNDDISIIQKWGEIWQDHR